MNAVERAAELGAEHGTAATRAWLDRNYPHGITHPTQRAVVLSLVRNPAGLLSGEPLPVPDLSGDDITQHAWFERVLDVRLTLVQFEDVRRAYCAAFTAAVEATVRAAVQS